VIAYSQRYNLESARGFSYIAASEPVGLRAPCTIVVRPASAVASVRQTVGTVARLHLAVVPPVQAGGWTRFSVILDDDPYGAAAMDTIKALRGWSPVSAAPKRRCAADARLSLHDSPQLLTEP
jgi:hypothetical protein